jgi:exopolyphosphatase/guanosine-5'-triphosphate,3'-diphosphate pyrophosphatase
MEKHVNEPCAAIDVGTNTLLMLVARVREGGTLEVLEDHCATPRLGEGLARSGVLAPAAQERALEALAGYARRLAQLGLPRERTRAVGTAVLRRASNATEFLARARERTGLAIEVISEEQEAELGHLAVRSELGGARAAILDVGGGSTEYCSADGRVRLSIPIGALVLGELHPGPGGAAELLAAARAAAARFPANGAQGETCVLLGGTAVNLACLVLGLPRFDHLLAEGAPIPLEQALVWAERLQSLPEDARRAYPIEADRARILPAGLACTAAALERLNPARARASGRGLRFGLLRALAAGGGVAGDGFRNNPTLDFPGG